MLEMWCKQLFEFRQSGSLEELTGRAQFSLLFGAMNCVYLVVAVWELRDANGICAVPYSHSARRHVRLAGGQKRCQGRGNLVRRWCNVTFSATGKKTCCFCYMTTLFYGVTCYRAFTAATVVWLTGDALLWISRVTSQVSAVSLLTRSHFE